MADNQQRHQQQHNPPPSPAPTPTPTPDPEVKPSYTGPRKAVDEAYRELLIELIIDVSNGKQLAAAKRTLYTFIDDCLPEEKSALLLKITGVSQRIRDIAQALAGESPSLIAKLQGD